MNTRRMFRALVFSGFLALLAPFAHAQFENNPDARWLAEQADRECLAKKRTQVSVYGFRMELRRGAYALFQKDPTFFILLAEAAKNYSVSLSSANKVNAIYIYDQYDDVGTNSRFHGIILFDYAEFTRYSDRPALRRAHLLQVFLHELGHKVYKEKGYQRSAENIYNTAMRGYAGDEDQKAKQAKLDPFFLLFSDSRYETIDDGCGHPSDNPDELFASAFMLTLVHPKELASRTAASPEPVRKLARELQNLMLKITAAFPDPKTFLASH